VVIAKNLDHLEGIDSLEKKILALHKQGSIAMSQNTSSLTPIDRIEIAEPLLSESLIEDRR